MWSGFERVGVSFRDVDSFSVLELGGVCCLQMGYYVCGRFWGRVDVELGAWAKPWCIHHAVICREVGRTFARQLGAAHREKGSELCCAERTAR